MSATTVELETADPDLCDDLANALDDYDTWIAGRQDLSEAEGTAGDPVAPGDWHDSDDAGLELLGRMADLLRRL